MFYRHRVFDLLGIQRACGFLGGFKMPKCKEPFGSVDWAKRLFPVESGFVFPAFLRPVSTPQYFLP